MKGRKGETLPGEKGGIGEEGPIGSKGEMGSLGPSGPKGFFGFQGIQGLYSFHEGLGPKSQSYLYSVVLEFFLCYSN